MKRKYKKANSRRSSKKKRLRHFGGRAGARGVNYESRVAAFIAANALCGDGTALWDGVDGSNIANITLQAPEAVDDIIIGLKGAETDRIFISAKHRAKSVPLTEQSGAFTETVDAFVTQFRSAAAEARKPPRFIWALPSSAGAVATQHLATVLNSHRSEASDAPFDAFINSRNKDERKALEAFVRRASSTWRQQEGSPISVDTLRALLRATWVETYDFGVAQHHERTAKTNLR